MKKKSLIFLLMLAIMLTTAVSAEAYTGRLGADRISFNPTRIVTKTADYTVTTSDSQVNVTVSSADITITLPTISSVRSTSGGSSTFKILKTDATSFKVAVTPATGDTIGEESARYIINQNDYIVISVGPGNDWSVDYESPYSTEDHEVGTTNITPNVEVVTAANTIAASECGTTYYLNSATEFASTLPTLSTVPAGCDFTFRTKAAASGANYTVLSGNSLENLISGSLMVAGAIVACATEDTITLVDGNAVADWVRVISDGAAWHIGGEATTTGKMTCTQAD